MYQRFDKMQLFSKITVFFKIAFLTIKFVTKQPVAVCGLKDFNSEPEWEQN